MSPDDPNAPLPPQTLQALLEGTAGHTGKEFFDELVRHVCEALETRAAWVTEWLPESRRLRALAFWYDGGPYGDYEYDIAGTPCEPVIETCDLFYVRDDVSGLFPDDPDLAAMDAVSYMGVPLLDTDETLLGHLAVLHDAPLREGPRTESVFRVFAERAAAELRRVRRDHDLAEREAKLAALVGSAMDAIVEIDAELRVMGLNRAAERTFRCRLSEPGELELSELLAPDSRDRIERLIIELCTRPVEERTAWIPEGLEGRRGDGVCFPAEATLSGFELNGEQRATLILRNVDDRLAAEERIRALTSEAAYLREEIQALQGFDEIIGESEALRATLADVERVAARDTAVLITGETGTGKELVARAIHERSPRAGGPLIKVNCAAISPNLQESEFFGHAQGAFTGATQAREGRFQLADGGTIFLDEIGEMSLELQAKLLRVIQEGEFEAVGDTRTRTVDVRLVAATNRDLEAMVAEGSFRNDLLYRLNVFPVSVPPLRERGEDVILLAEFFANRHAGRSGRAGVSLSEDAKARLRRYDWPGNVRELENVMERALITSTDGRTPNLARALPETTGTPDARPPRTERILTVTEMQDLERANLLRALEAAGWKVSGEGGAAQRLGLNPNTLSSRMRSLGIERPRA